MDYHSVTAENPESRGAMLARKHRTNVLFHFIASITVLLTFATAFLAIALAVFLANETSRPYALSILASILQVLSLCTLCVLVVHQIYGQKKVPTDNEFTGTDQRHRYLEGLGVAPSIIAGAAVAVALGKSKSSLAGESRRILGRSTEGYLNIAFIIWGLTVLAQVSFYVLLVVIRKQAHEHVTDLPVPLASSQENSTEEIPSLEMAQQSRPGTPTSETADQSRPTTSTTVQSNPFQGSEYSAPPSLITTDSTPSLCSSISTIRRPSLSKPKLAARQHSYPRHSSKSAPATPRASQDSGFDSWDTSSVSPHIRETVLQSSPSTMKIPVLEPIPGSRSPSPAKALEGPFFQPSPPESSPPSPLPQPPYSRPTSPRSPSSEDHIHPLFRSSSPTPPPTTSSGTVVTASPSAGQVIDPRALYRMRSGSAPASPSPLVRAESFEVFMLRRNPTSENVGLGPNSSCRPATSGGEGV